MKIGIVGTGRMGTAIAQRLLDRGHEVLAWNRTAHRAHAAHEAGARWTPGLRDLVRECEILVSFLSDDEAVKQVYLGDGGILSAAVRGRLFLEMSTVRPHAHVPIATALDRAGAQFLECPVSGSVAAAASGTLTGFASGDPDAFSRARDLLAQLCRRLEYLGPLGAGPRLKLAANLLLTVFWQALGESLLLADASPKDWARVIDLLADSNIAAGILKVRAPQIVESLQGQARGSAAFDVDTMRKDLRYMLQEAAARGAVLPLAGGTLQALDLASSQGAGKVDSTSYPAYWLARHDFPASREVRDSNRNRTKSTPAVPINAPCAVPVHG